MPMTQEERLQDVKTKAESLAVTLRDASDEGVSHALILPQLVLVFREAFGEMPPQLVAQLAELEPAPEATQ